MKFLEDLEKSRNFWFILFGSFIFFILRFPSLFEPNWYGDEGVYQALGLALGKGRLLYQGIWDNKPPFLYLIYEFFGSDQFLIRLTSLIFGIFTIIIFFYLSKKLFRSQKSYLLSTAFFLLLFGLPILEGNIANAENFMLLPTLLSALVISNLKEPPRQKDKNKNIIIIFFAGLLLGISFLFKTVAIFDFTAFLFFLFFIDKNILSHIKKKNYQTYEVKKLFSYVSGFSVLPIATALYFLLNGGFSQFIEATLFSNIGYVGYGNNFLIPQGLLIIKILALLGLSYFLFVKRKVLGLTGIFALLWFSFSLFNAFFSQRPYAHYLLVLLPSFSILIGCILEYKSLRKLYFAFLLFFSLFIIKNFNFYTNIQGYYANFMSFEMNKKNVTEYQRFFDRITPLDYELASFIRYNTKSSDYIFTWGNNAQLYKLTEKLPPGKYTVAYHITGARNGISQTDRDLKLRRPKFIIIMPYMNYFPFQLLGYTPRIIIDKAYVYERIF